MLRKYTLGWVWGLANFIVGGMFCSVIVMVGKLPWQNLSSIFSRGLFVH